MKIGPLNLNPSAWRLFARVIACLMMWAVCGRGTLRAAEDDLESLEEKQFLAAVDRVAPCVVRIETFGGLEKVEQVLVGQGATTGLIVDTDGYIVSSAFNFVQQPSSILVSLPGGQRLPATVVARDRSRMLVLLKVNAKEKLPVPLAVPRAEMTVGQWALALGRTFEGTRPNISVGILSATNRIWGKAIQTDAKVSPSNYGGPLVDMRGRVFGILVPASPQAQGEVAGAEWYDSGIGFAVPLVEFTARLATLKEGKDLHPGLLGITLKGKNVQSDPAEFAACPTHSPAGKAGLKAGDKVVECAGQKITSIAQLKHALGPHYAGDRVPLVALRGEQRIEATVELAAELLPFVHPFLGLLPKRDLQREPAGVAVRFVFPGSPAAEAGIRADDTLTSLSGTPVRDLAHLGEQLAALEPGQEATLGLSRAGQAIELKLKLGSLSSEVPGELPPAHAPLPKAENPPPVGRITVKLPEQASESVAYVPENYHPDLPYGLVVWLHPPGKFDEDEFLQRWRGPCAQQGLIVLAPKAADKARWEPTEIEMVRKSIDQLIDRYHIDRSRIVAHGYQGGAAMAYLVAFEHRDLVRGAAVVDAALPARVGLPETDAVRRLAIYSAKSEKSPAAPAIAAGTKKLVAAKFPVTERSFPGEPRYLAADEFAEFLRWIDSLDRF